MRSRIDFRISLILVLFVSLLAPALASAQTADAKVGGNLLPDGFYITPTAAPGSIFLRLKTGLRPDGSADADGAVNTALSPETTDQYPQHLSGPVVGSHWGSILRRRRNRRSH